LGGGRGLIFEHLPDLGGVVLAPSLERGVKLLVPGLKALLEALHSNWGLASVVELPFAGFDNVDPSRIAAGIVVGIGFLGAGTIIHSQGEVVGLTTAAGIWVVAAIGMALGLGLFVLAGVTTILSLFILFLMEKAERRFKM